MGGPGMRIFALGGEPATGKSSIMNAILATSEHPVSMFKYGLLRGHYTTLGGRETYILGIYAPGEVFSGTDKLSMAVQKDAERFLTGVNAANVLFEGDRLFNQSFLERCKAAGTLKALILTVAPSELARRHVERRDSQNDRFLKGRATKYRNLIAANPEIQLRKNESLADQSEIITEILSFFQA